MKFTDRFYYCSFCSDFSAPTALSLLASGFPELTTFEIGKLCFSLEASPRFPSAKASFLFFKLSTLLQEVEALAVGGGTEGVGEGEVVGLTRLGLTGGLPKGIVRLGPKGVEEGVGLEVLVTEGFIKVLPPLGMIVASDGLAIRAPAATATFVTIEESWFNKGFNGAFLRGGRGFGRDGRVPGLDDTGFPPGGVN
ncbi:hypothetical protein V2J09_011718 [Rumex salicifolius]